MVLGVIMVEVMVEDRGVFHEILDPASGMVESPYDLMNRIHRSSSVYIYQLSK